MERGLVLDGRRPRRRKEDQYRAREGEEGCERVAEEDFERKRKRRKRSSAAIVSAQLFLKAPQRCSRVFVTLLSEPHWQQRQTKTPLPSLFPLSLFPLLTSPSPPSITAALR